MKQTKIGRLECDFLLENVKLHGINYKFDQRIQNIPHSILHFYPRQYS